ncbi:MAG TPA: GNAT family N-acetyltransferase [Candidatus Dormibacteraeota bacterium]|nr:GNAT family N-acetyltransferase [Candidatus Dormibacteraeota bacterium]
MGSESDLVATRLGRGCRAFVACLGDEVAAYGWVSSSPEWIGEVRLQICPGEGEAYLWNCVTLGPHRRRGFFGALIEQVAARLQAEGLSRLWIAEAGGPAVPALSAAGYRPVVEITEARWGPIRRLLALPAREADPESVAAARRAVSLGGRRLGVLPAVRRH